MGKAGGLRLDKYFSSARQSVRRRSVIDFTGHLIEAK